MNVPGQAQQAEWDEDKCRNYIIRTLDWIPRNFGYQDGLYFLHTHLQLAFGDENGHLATGVLEELIELDGIPPFPEALFQRWKYAYRRRNEVLELPHTPPTRTINRPVVPTQRAIEHRLLTSPQTEHGNRTTNSRASRLSPSPTRLLETRGDHARAIEYTSYVSRKGKKPRILSAPTQEEVQKMLDDPQFGRGGRIQSMRYVHTPVTNNTASEGQLSPGALIYNTSKTSIPPKSENLVTREHTQLAVQSNCGFLKDLVDYLRKAARSGPASAQSQSTQEVEEDELNFQKYIREIFRAENATPPFDFQKHLEEMHWPSEVEIPNANFARKYRLVPPGQSLPIEVLNGSRQWTLNEEETKTLNRLWQQARREMNELSDGEERVTGRLCQRFFQFYADRYNAPLTTSLFHDSGLDFAWGNKSMEGWYESEPSLASIVAHDTPYETQSDLSYHTRGNNRRKGNLAVNITRNWQLGSRGTSEGPSNWHSAQSHPSLDDFRNELLNEEKTSTTDSRSVREEASKEGLNQRRHLRSDSGSLEDLFRRSLVESHLQNSLQEVALDSGSLEGQFRHSLVESQRQHALQEVASDSGSLEDLFRHSLVESQPQNSLQEVPSDSSSLRIPLPNTIPDSHLLGNQDLNSRHLLCLPRTTYLQSHPQSTDQDDSAELFILPRTTYDPGTPRPETNTWSNSDNMGRLSSLFKTDNVGGSQSRSWKKWLPWSRKTDEESRVDSPTRSPSWSSSSLSVTSPATPAPRESRKSGDPRKAGSSAIETWRQEVSVNTRGIETYTPTGTPAKFKSPSYSRDRRTSTSSGATWVTETASVIQWSPTSVTARVPAPPARTTPRSRPADFDSMYDASPVGSEAGEETAPVASTRFGPYVVPSIPRGVFEPRGNTTFSISEDPFTGATVASARVEIPPGSFSARGPSHKSPRAHLLIPRTRRVARNGILEIQPVRNQVPDTPTRGLRNVARIGSARAGDVQGNPNGRLEIQPVRTQEPDTPTRGLRNVARIGTTRSGDRAGGGQENPNNISRVLQWREKRMGLDGASDDFGDFGDFAGFGEFCSPLANVDNGNHNHNTISQDNGYEITICSNVNTTNSKMDANRKSASSSNSANPPPLRINKQSKQVRIAESQQQLSDTSPHKQSTIFPPRTSSMRNTGDSPVADSVRRREAAHIRQHSDATSGRPSPLSSYSYRGHYLSDASGSRPSTEETARSTLSSFKGHYISGSTDIIGNFVPIDSQAMAAPTAAPQANCNRGNLDALGQVKISSNPYQFEPDTPLPARHHSHQTTFTDFISYPHDSELAPSPQVFYLKKSPSTGNAIYNGRKPTPMVPLSSKPGARGLQRCESSPNVSSPAVFKVQYQRSASPDLAARFGEIVDPTTPIRRGRSPPREERRGRSCEEDRTPVPANNQRYFGELRSESPFRAPTANEHIQSYLRESRPESPLRVRTSNDHIQSYMREPRPESPFRTPSRDVADHYGASPSTTSRYGPRSPTKTLRDVVEHDEVSLDSPDLTRSPKKRSRSPMKKMFGEHGWLGRSPAEAPENIRQNQKAAAASGKEKMSMMGKLKTKLGEFAEKADLSPIGRGRNSNDTPAKISVLSVSLGPPEQARILMEVELMLVHTANSFLMNQFSQGRMAVDSIKKTVDAWKARGRPTVIEFMYDQSTQRDLVAINQQNFRFHGERAGDSVRINSMLYSWKLVASQMSIRTFCDADTIILKLLFDIESILELLGARDPLLTRLQQIRATANERMRLARLKKERDSTQDVPMGRERTWHSNSAESSDGPSIRESMDDPYGGLKLVPDTYRGFN